MNLKHSKQQAPSPGIAFKVRLQFDLGSSFQYVLTSRACFGESRVGSRCAAGV